MTTRQKPTSFDGIVKGKSSSHDNDYEDEYGDPIAAEEEEFIVLLEEQGKEVPASSPQRRRKRRGRVLAILTKAAAAARQQKLKLDAITSRRQKQCLCFTAVLAAIALPVLLGVQVFHLQKTGPQAKLPADAMKVAFQIAQHRFQKRLKQAVHNQNNNNTTTKQDFEISPQGYANLQASPFETAHPTHRHKVLNSIRIPKASSSALSVTARALAGCHPDGFPCCRMPGDPVGSCPRDGLQCPVVTGCGGHRPNFNGTEPIITKIREPSSRLLSGFFYETPHRPPKEKGYSWNVFENEYIKNAKFRNVMTKMFSGYFAYNKFEPKLHTVKHAKKNICRTAWFGQVEYPLLSSLMLYESQAFQWLVPNPVTFGLPATDTNSSEHEDDDRTLSESAAAEEPDGLRVNHNEQYATFKDTTFPNHDGMELVRRFNQEDFELYEFMEQLFCLRLLQSTPDLVVDAERAGIALEEIASCRQVLRQSDKTFLDLCPKGH